MKYRIKRLKQTIFLKNVLTLIIMYGILFKR